MYSAGLEIAAVFVIVPSAAALLAFKTEQNPLLWYAISAVFAFLALVSGEDYIGSIPSILSAGFFGFFLIALCAHRCPYCQKVISAKASVCPYCHAKQDISEKAATPTS